jgi:nucleoside-diphosphate-sugar epimerase
MRVLITGANGFLGSWLARRLVDRGDEVRCLVRAGADLSALEGVSAQRVHGDVTQPETLPKALEGVDVVFHLAGIRRAAVRDEFIRVNAEGTRHVCEAMVKAGTRRMVLCGSLAASGPSSPQRPRVESDPFCPEEWYGESKALAEQIVFEYANRLEVTSCRPARILGPGDHENLTFFKVVKKGFILRLGGPVRPLSMVDVEDVVDQLLLQGDEKEAVGEAFFAASDETTHLEELLTWIAESLQVKARTLYVPEGALKAIGATADVITNVTGKRLPVNRKLARQLLAPGWTCSIQKAKDKLGYRPKISLRESIQRSAESYLKAGWL